MSLTSGSRLGPYEVRGVIGAGGMGEVYRARDTTLHRDVAIKVLPAAVAGHPRRLVRFERRTRGLADEADLAPGQQDGVALVRGAAERRGKGALGIGGDRIKNGAHGPYCGPKPRLGDRRRRRLQGRSVSSSPRWSLAL